MASNTCNNCVHKKTEDKAYKTLLVHPYVTTTKNIEKIEGNSEKYNLNTNVCSKLKKKQTKRCIKRKIPLLQLPEDGDERPIPYQQCDRREIDLEVSKSKKIRCKCCGNDDILNKSKQRIIETTNLQKQQSDNICSLSKTVFNNCSSVKSNIFFKHKDNQCCLNHSVEEKSSNVKATTNDRELEQSDIVSNVLCKSCQSCIQNKTPRPVLKVNESSLNNVCSCELEPETPGSAAKKRFNPEKESDDEKKPEQMDLKTESCKQCNCSDKLIPMPGVKVILTQTPRLVSSGYFPAPMAAWTLVQPSHAVGDKKTTKKMNYFIPVDNNIQLYPAQQLPVYNFLPNMIPENNYDFKDTLDLNTNEEDVNENSYEVLQKTKNSNENGWIFDKEIGNPKIRSVYLLRIFLLIPNLFQHSLDERYNRFFSERPLNNFISWMDYDKPHALRLDKDAWMKPATEIDTGMPKPPDKVAEYYKKKRIH